MKMRIFITLFFTLLFASFSFASFEELKQKIDPVVSAYISSERNVGAIVGVIDRNNQANWNYGTLEMGKEEPISADTLFEIGSISKVFTGIILASLANEGVVSLKDKISKYLNDLPLTTADITLVELSTHTSGLPRLPNNFNPRNIKNPYADYTEDHLLKFIRSFIPEKHPTEFDLKYYSNVGVGLLGYILTIASKKTYEELLKEKITKPLGMNDTVVSLNEEQLKRFALGYDAALEPTSPWDLNVLVGAGGIRSTTQDMLKFVRANLFPDETSISKHLKLAQENQHTNKNLSIGLGWVRYSDEEKSMYNHSGGTGGYRSLVAFSHETGKGIVSLTNTASEIGCIANIAVFGWECSPPKDYPVPDKFFDAYVGTYESPFLTFVITRKKTYLVYELVGQEKGRLTALSESKFSISGIATMEFHKNDEGQVSHMVFEQGSFKAELHKK
ncbi:MAG TPA: serine hydrolase [Bdellovibrionota bacterium]|nr:serine hydrolase [Bdellovibrionota bacterium]